MRSPQVSEAVERIYSVFGPYARPEKADFCADCYDPREIEYFRKTPLRGFDAGMARSLVWEAHDHWPNLETYKHYLPLILDSLAPPRRCADMYEDHLFDNLRALGFQEWPVSEREAFWAYVVAVQDALVKIDAQEAEEWKVAASKLAGGPYRIDDVL